MPFKFEPTDRSVEAAVRRLATEQIDLGLSAIDEHEDKADTAPAIHSLRKTCKRLRSLLRLVRPSFSRFGKENAAIREAAAKLSPVRDADVMMATFDTVADRLDANEADRFRDAILARAARAREDVDARAALAMAGAELRVIRARIPDWRLEADDFAALSGCKAIYKRARRDRDVCARRPSAEDFHEWRKQVKHHYYHLCLLRGVAPHVLEGQRELAKALGETLGDHHDVDVFLLALDDDVGLFRNVEGIEALRMVLRERQERCGALALSLGAELLGERPRGLDQRLKRYWMNWRRIGVDGHGSRDRAQVPDQA